jgi:uncharacterized membrane protein
MATPALPPEVTQSAVRTVAQTIRESKDLWGSSMLVLLLGADVWLRPHTPSVWRVMLGLLAGLILPGYALISLLFPRKSDIDGVARWALTLVLNVMLVIVVALALSFVHIRLDAQSVTGGLGGLVLLLAGMASWRRRQIPAGELFLLRLPRGRYPWITLGLAGFLAITTWMVAGTELHTTSFEFYLTTTAGSLSGYPFQVLVGTRYLLELHVRNNSSQIVTYRLIITDRSGSYRSNQMIRVAATGNWSEPILLPATAPPRSEVVTFTLYQRGKAVRKLWIRYRIVP